MIQIGILVAVVLSLINLVVLIFMFKRLTSIGTGSVESNGQDELRALREEVSRSEQAVRSEVRSTQETTANTLVVNIGELTKTLTAQLEGVRTTFDERFQSLQQGNENKLDQIRQTVTEHLQTTSDTLVATVGELGNTQKSATDMLVATVGKLGEAQTQQLQDVTDSTNNLTQSNETGIENIRKTVDERIQTLQANNESKLDQIRQTVTEHLQATSDTLVATIGELGKAQKSATDTLVATVSELGEAQTQQLQDMTDSTNNLTQSNETGIENIRKTVDERIQTLQANNESKLDQIRQTVTEHLQATSDTLVATIGELGKAQKSATDTLVATVSELGEAQTQQLQDMTDSTNNLTRSNETGIENIRKTVDERIQNLQTNNENSLDQIRQTVTENLQTATDTLVTTIGELGEAQTRQLANGTKAINDLTQTNKSSIEDVRTIVDKRLQDMQISNEGKLDQIRHTVDEQLQSTLEKRLGESFNIVSKRLEEVQRGLGEMQNLATGVGDLKRVLTNVKARGTWGEVQLGSLLEEVLTPDQYSANVKLHENSHEEVEYAIRLPGNDEGPDSCVWLPIDSKFPLADYERLVDASDTSDIDAVQEATQAFVRSVQVEAKKIRDKYVAPPKTTDFAIMFLPTEGLYAEVLRAPGQVTELLQRYRIVVAGPTTLAAILSSLRMGFRTLAIEKRSSEVWEVLAAVKTEFGKFGGVMDKLKRQLNTASKTIDETGVRTRAMERRLRSVEELPIEEATVQLGFSDGMPIIEDD